MTHPTPALAKLEKAHIFFCWPVEDGSGLATFTEGATEHFSLGLSADQLTQASAEVRSVVEFDGQGDYPQTPILNLLDRHRIFSMTRESSNEFFFEDLGTGHFGLTLNQADLLQLANDFDTLANQLTPQSKRKPSPR